MYKHKLSALSQLYTKAKLDKAFFTAMTGDYAATVCQRLVLNMLPVANSAAGAFTIEECHKNLVDSSSNALLQYVGGGTRGVIRTAQRWMDSLSQGAPATV